MEREKKGLGNQVLFALQGNLGKDIDKEKEVWYTDGEQVILTIEGVCKDEKNRASKYCLISMVAMTVSLTVMLVAYWVTVLSQGRWIDL